MLRRKKARSPELVEPAEQPGSRDVSPTITTKILQSAKGLVCQFTMNGQTIWQEELVSATGQPITCLKDLPEDFTLEDEYLDLDDTQTCQIGHEDLRVHSAHSRRGNNTKEKNHRKPTAAHKSQPAFTKSPATPLQPLVLPKQRHPPQNNSNNKHNSSPLAPATGKSRQTSSGSKTPSPILLEPQPVSTPYTTPATLTVPKAKQRDMSIRQFFRRPGPNDRDEERGRRERRDYHEPGHSHRAHGHRGDHGHSHRGGRDARHRNEDGEGASRHRHYAYAHRQEHERRASVDVPVSFDEEYFCYHCGRMRSAAFRRKYSLEPGQLPKANFCLKCRFDSEEEDGTPLVWRGLRYYCYGCGIVRSANYHDNSRILGRDEICPPNYCSRCREASLSWDDSIIMQSEVGLAGHNVYSHARRDDLSEIEEESEDDAERFPPSDEIALSPRDLRARHNITDLRESPERSDAESAAEPSPRDLRGMYHNADLNESRDINVATPSPGDLRGMYHNADLHEPRERVEAEPAPVNEPIAHASSGAHHSPTVESEVDSEPELHAAQRARESRVINDDAGSASTPTSQGTFTPETGGDSPNRPEQNSNDGHAAAHASVQPIRNPNYRDVGTQTDDLPTPPAMRWRAPSVAKSVHWPDDELLSTSQEYKHGDPSGRAGPANNTHRSEHYNTADSSRFSQPGYSRLDRAATRNGYPDERFDSQTRSNSGPTDHRYGNSNGFADYNESNMYDVTPLSMPMRKGKEIATSSTQGYDDDDNDLPSASATLTGMPIPTHLLNAGFYRSSAAQATPASASTSSQARSQDFNNQMPDRGMPNFSMPMNTRDHENLHDEGSSPAPWGGSDDAVPVPDVSTTCECDFDAIFRDMPEPDMNDEFYSHRPTDSDLEAMARYARSIVNGIDEAHRRLNGDMQDNAVASGSGSNRRDHENDGDRTPRQYSGSPSTSIADEHFHSGTPPAQYNQDMQMPRPSSFRTR